MYTTTVTSQGTISLPIALRKKYDVRAGSTVRIIDGDTVQIIMGEPIEMLRARNATRIGKSRIGILKNGAGFEAYVQEKYGKK